MVCGFFDRRVECIWTDHFLSIVNFEKKNARTKFIISKKLNYHKAKLSWFNKIDSSELGFL
jgi:hypothetical protein